MSKRKYNDEESFEINNFENNLKRLTKKAKIDNTWISGTSVANYLNGEPLLDWLKLYYNKFGFNEHRITRSATKKYKTYNNNSLKTNINPLLSNGLLFESKVYEDLQKKFKKNFYLCQLNKINYEIDFNKGYVDTLRHIELNTPIIAQAVLIDNETKLRGIADLLVRYDYVNKIFKKKVIDVTEQNKQKYLVIDIKWTSMTLCVDGKTIRNEGRFKAYKGQIFIYNYILGKIQNYMSPVSLILAKNWKIDSTYNPIEGYNCYDLAGIINYEDKDNNFIKKTLDAINWIYKVRKEGIAYVH